MRVIWIGDHMSMDDTYWQDDKEHEGGKHTAFCTVTLKLSICKSEFLKSQGQVATDTERTWTMPTC